MTMTYRENILSRVGLIKSDHNLDAIIDSINVKLRSEKLPPLVEGLMDKGFDRTDRFFLNKVRCPRALRAINFKQHHEDELP